MEPVFPRIEMTAGPDEGLMITVKEGEQTIGRVNGVEIYLPDTSLSRRHAIIKKTGDTITIRDLGSRNGTLVNGKRLSPGTEYPLEHLAHLQVGIYEWRFAARAATPQEIKERKQNNVVSVVNEEPSQVTHNDTLDAQQTTAIPLGDVPVEAPESLLPQEEPVSVSEKNTSEDALPVEAPLSENPEIPADKALIEASGTLPAKLSSKNRFSPLLLGLIGFLLLAAGMGYYFRAPIQRKMADLGLVKIPVATDQESDEGPFSEPLHPKGAQSAPVQVVSDNANMIKTEETPPVFNELKPLNQQLTETKAPDVKNKDIFLDLKSEPIPARITFEGRTLGVTPLKSPVSLKTGNEYEVIAEFDLRDIRDRYQMKYNFKVDTTVDVLSHTFAAPIGVIKIQKLPRNVDFYLEGYYAYDKYKSNPVRLTEIAYGKPVYAPYGHYVIELREKVKMGDSDTLVNEIRYHREFDLDEKRTSIDLSIQDRDLQFFPAKLQSIPSGAIVFVDEKEVGKTPFDGDLPLGAHSLRLSREGYFDYKSQLEMRTNTPYEATIKLETSKVGQYINRAKEQRRIGQTQEALNELVEALKLNTTAAEKGEIYCFLGELYVDSKDYSQASKYFTLAKESQNFKYRALLGLAKVAFYSSNTSESLKLVIEVLINLPDKDPVVREARSLFSQLSALKSVMYISTDPPGAEVVVNGQLASQKTPLILTELGLGSYRLEIKKTGFKTQQVKKSLKLNEFVPVLLKLEADQI